MPEYPPEVTSSVTARVVPRPPTLAVATSKPAGSLIGDQCCAGRNDCKGKGNCKTALNACKGQNPCKAHGGCKPLDCP